MADFSSCKKLFPCAKPVPSTHKILQDEPSKFLKLTRRLIQQEFNKEDFKTAGT